MTYQIDYSGQNPEQRNVGGGDYAPPAHRYEAPRRGFAVPNIVKTGVSFIAGAAALFSAEMWGPEWMQPSTPMGHYEANIEEDVKEAELRVQAQYDPYVAQVKASAEQEVEQYKARMQLMLTYYSAGLDRGKFYAEQTAKFQAQVAGAQMDRTRAEQSGEIQLVSLGRMFGHIANVASDGAGNRALDWSQARSAEMADELQRAAENGVRVNVDGWNTNLPDPAMLQMQILDIKPLQLPPPPVIQHFRAGRER